MFIPYKIVNEKVESLHEISTAVKIPVSAQDAKLAITLFQHVFQSQNKEFAQLHNIRTGVGLAAPQVGVNKRIFAVHAHDEDETLSLAIINPKIVSTSKSMIYLNGGEGCLSVDRPTEGVTPRYSKITVEGFVYNFENGSVNKKKFTLKDYLAIVFQHEYDHLDGILYVDKLMDEKDALAQGINPLWEEIEEDEEKA